MPIKVGILNFHYSNHNYGAVLQAAALEDMVKKLGYEAEHVDFIPVRSPPKPMPIGKRISRLIKKGVLKLVMQKLRSAPGGKARKISNAVVFENFREQWVTRSSHRYHRKEDLQQINNGYTAIIVGSDQVWRPEYTGEYYLSYFLDFLPSDVKRISYAASFGVEEWEAEDDEITNSVHREIQLFDSISVRELSGVSICQNVFGTSAAHVLDPVLLRGRAFFEEIIDSYDRKSGEEQNPRQGQIVCHKLDEDPNFSKFVQRFSESSQLESENIHYHSLNEVNEFLDVPLWLKKIRDSEFVITDSFHCVCLSIIFEKRFICLLNQKRGVTRLTSLLEQLGIEHLIHRNVSEAPETINHVVDINYESVNSKLESMREYSEQFLKTALKSH